MKRLTLILLSFPALVLAISARSPDPAPRCLPGSPTPVLIAGGTTVIGDDRGYADERPSFRAAVGAFDLDVTEVTNAQFSAFVAATGYVTTAEKRGDSMVFSPPGAGEMPISPDQWWRIVKGANWRLPFGPVDAVEAKPHEPVVHVSFADAQAYARWAGRRLPSEAEFERAAQGRQGATLDQSDPDSANTWQGPFPHDNLKQDGHTGLAPVGCYKANAYGAHDLIGNVWEWTASPYWPGHGPHPISLIEKAETGFDPRQSGVPVRVIKGGSFLCAPNYCARYRPAARHAQAEDETASHIGFRTVSSLSLDKKL